MKRSAPRSKPVNTRFIYYVLIVGFALLLSLIWYIGRFSKEKLSLLSSRADERTQNYTSRLKLAIEIRAQTETVIAEARFSAAMREAFRIGGPPFKIKLNEAKSRLEKLLKDGKHERTARLNTLPPDELAAWTRVEQSAAEFWQTLDTAEQRTPSKRFKEEARAEAAIPAEAPAATPPPPPQIDEAQQKQQDLYNSRLELSQATKDLADLLSDRQRTLLDEVKYLQGEAAAQVSERRWWTFLVGLGVAFVAYVLIQRQVRQNRSATKKAQEAEGLTTSVLNSLSNDVLAINEHGAVLTVNPAFLKDFKLTREESLQQDYRTLLSRSAELRAYVEKAAQQSNSKPLQHQRVEVKPDNERPDNEREDTRLFNVDVAPRLVGEEPRGHVVVLTDVTEAERIREEASRNRTLSTVGQLTAQVAHEIYNPLGAIKLNVDLLEMQISDDKDVKHTVARLKRGLEHLSTIVMDLRYLTRQREPERRPTELNALLDEVIELAGDRLERSRVIVKCSYAPEKLQGDYDPLQLRKVFLNLLINAVEASPHAGEIELRTRLVKPEELNNEFAAERGALVISVIDHGVGMSPETKRRIFEAFYSTKQHGTGLGMMITQEIIKKHHGKIEIESAEEKGTTVSVYLPV